MSVHEIALTRHFDEFVESSVRSGRFLDANEVVHEGLRMLEESEKSEEAKLAWLRQAAKLGFDALERGEGVMLETPEELGEFMSQIHEESKRKEAVRLSAAKLP